jgi:hypothetical protein
LRRRDPELDRFLRQYLFTEGSIAPRPQAADTEACAVTGAVAAFVAAGLGGRLDRRDRALREEVLAQEAIELRVATAQPLQRHGGVLLLLVAVVGQDRPELRIVAGVDALVVPVDRLELLHERDDGPVILHRLRPEPLLRFVELRAAAGHARTPFSPGLASCYPEHKAVNRYLSDFVSWRRWCPKPVSSR